MKSKLETDATQSPPIGRSRIRAITLMGSFAVIYATLRVIPLFPVIGVPGATFASSDILVPIYGIILGPYLGAGSAMVGTFLAIIFGKPMIFLGLDFLPGTLGAFAVGMVARGKSFQVAVLFSLLLATFWILPLTEFFIPIAGAIMVPFNWLHLVSVAMLISPIGRRAQSWLSSQSPSHVLRGVAVVAFAGTMFQHTVGAILFESIIGLYLGIISSEAWVGTWTVIFFLYPAERAVLVAGSILLGVPLIRTLRSSGYERKLFSNQSAGTRN